MENLKISGFLKSGVKYRLPGSGQMDYTTQFCVNIDDSGNLTFTSYLCSVKATELVNNPAFDPPH